MADDNIADGCASFHGTVSYDGTTHSQTNYSNVRNLKRGDTIVVTSDIPSAIFSGASLDPLKSGPTGFTYVVPADTSAIHFVGRDPLFIVTLLPPYFISFSCTPAAAGPTNSQILEQTRQTFSKVGAQASATALGDATSGAIGDAFGGGGTTQFGNGTFSTSFAALEDANRAEITSSDSKPSGKVKAAHEAFAALGYAKAPYLKAPPLVRSPWHVWIDGRFTGFEDRSAASFDGWHSNVTGGASYRFTDNFLAGVLIGYENSRYSMTAFGVPTSLRGEGVSGGGYFGWKFFDRMRLDGMLTYGRIDYGAAAGLVSGSFGADRITGMSKLSGRYGFGALWLEPSAMLTIASERQGSFTDTAAVVHDKFNFVVGRASTGGTIGMPIAWEQCVVTPSFGVFGDYRFGDQTAAAANIVPTFNNGWSAHVNGGLSIAMPNNVTASATGEYGGLGDNIQYWRAKGSLGVKF